MPPRILVVDDEEDVRVIVRSALEPDYEILEAENGLDALEKIKRYEPDFVCLDVMMPMMDGFQTCEMIRRNPQFHTLPVLFLTALTEKEKIKEGYSKGANLYLTKPFEPERLKRNIDVHMQSNPPSGAKKRYSIEQIREFEEAGIAPTAPGAEEYEQKAAAAGAAPQTAPSSAAAKPRVLIVDDDHDLIEMMCASLESTVEPCWAFNGMEAIQKLVKYQPDILIIDIMLPKMSGFQLCQTIRSQSAFKSLPIVVCSAKSSDRDQTFAKRVGANGFLPKPFKQGDLVGEVKKMTALPGFRVRRKSMSYEQILDVEKPLDEQDVFDGEKEAADQTRSPVGMSSAKMNKFLKEQDDQDEVEKTRKLDKNEMEKVQRQEEDKKKRRILKFGRKD